MSQKVYRVSEGLPCLKQKNMHQTAMAQGVCIASLRVVVAAAAAAAAAVAAVIAAAAALPAAGHHEECDKGQATHSSCHSAETLVGTIASIRQSEDTHMLAVQLSQLYSLAVCSAAYH